MLVGAVLSSSRNADVIAMADALDEPHKTSRELKRKNDTVVAETILAEKKAKRVLKNAAKCEKEAVAVAAREKKASERAVAEAERRDKTARNEKAAIEAKAVLELKAKEQRERREREASERAAVEAEAMAKKSAELKVKHEEKAERVEKEARETKAARTPQNIREKRVQWHFKVSEWGQREYTIAKSYDAEVRIANMDAARAAKKVEDAYLRLWQILIDEDVYTDDAKDAAANAWEATAYVREAAAWEANSVTLELWLADLANLDAASKSERIRKGGLRVVNEATPEMRETASIARCNIAAACIIAGEASERVTADWAQRTRESRVSKIGCDAVAAMYDAMAEIASTRAKAAERKKSAAQKAAAAARVAAAAAAAAAGAHACVNASIEAEGKLNTSSLKLAAAACLI